ncbi:MAG TPA: cation diffusion facilitator family transporter [Myxococcota bacterium]|nr:cation diffusion facilitator family transporter [Myxococcota bacterium]HQK49796.1 cation diffusion facilitator family transporter [Myxococcota bacterium]
MSDRKVQVAGSSLLWAVVLTATKLIVGLFTGSLGILAEALHSALDLLAAGVTLYAVRQSARPADRDHPFGHGKFENFSAFVETLLLVLTSVWILWEAQERLRDPAFAGPRTSVWGFLVIGFAIWVDWHRSRALARVARETGSQALEADALHFQSDILSSAAVLLGLGGAALGLPQADPIAAVVVALVVLHVAWGLIRRSVHALLDRAPEGVADDVRKRVQAVTGVEEVDSVRVRTSGPDLHAEVVVRLDGGRPLTWAHDVTDRVEAAVKEGYPEARVTVHAEPLSPAEAPSEEDRETDSLP